MKILEILDNQIRIGDLVRHRITGDGGEIHSLHPDWNIIMLRWKGSDMELEWVQSLKKRKGLMLWNYLLSFPQWINSNEEIIFWLTNGRKWDKMKNKHV